MGDVFKGLFGSVICSSRISAACSAITSDPSNDGKIVKSMTMLPCEIEFITILLGVIPSTEDRSDLKLVSNSIRAGNIGSVKNVGSDVIVVTSISRVSDNFTSKTRWLMATSSASGTFFTKGISG